MGWISWLCPGINLKRWLLLFAVGVLLCALGLALFFNYQLMGKAEELLFQMTYLTTGRYSNGLIMTLGVAFSYSWLRYHGLWYTPPDQLGCFCGFAGEKRLADGNNFYAA